MRYITCDTEQEALDISAADMRATGGNTQTQYRYQVRECVAGKWHVCVNDDRRDVQGHRTHAVEPVWPVEAEL